MSLCKKIYDWVLIAAHQQITHEWWDRRREDFDLYTSHLVIREAGGGNPEAAAKRLSVLQDIPLMEMNEGAVSPAEQLIMQHAVPKDGISLPMSVIKTAVRFLLSAHPKNLWEDNMWKDMIVEEVRKFREEHAAQFSYNIKAIIESLKKQERESGRSIVSFSIGSENEDNRLKAFQ